MFQEDNVFPSTFNDCLDVIRQWQSRYPVLTVPIAETLGMRVYKVPNWPTDVVSGQIIKHFKDGGPNGYTILVNADHPTERRRFTIAHEIAHYILHRNRIGDGIEENALYQSRLDTEEERQANYFAIHDILVPDHLLERAIKDAMMEDSFTIPHLASMFEVPNSAMSIKMGIPYEVDPQDVVQRQG